VVGAGLGGLSLSIHLAVAGYEVTVYEANARPGGRANLIEEAGFRFDTGPSLLNYPWVLEDLFVAAGERLADHLELLRVDPAVGFHWPDGTRFRLSSDLPRLTAECERLDPGSSVGLARFLRDASRKYRIAFERLVTSNETNPLRWFAGAGPGNLLRLGLTRSLDGELRRHFRSRHLREALGSYAMYLGGSPFRLPGFFSILPYGELAHGLWLPRGGMYGLVEALVGLARRVGVTLRTGVRVEQIVVRQGRVAGVRTARGGIEEWPVVVSNVDVPTTDTELVQGPGGEGGRARARRTRMTPAVMTFYWGIRGRVPGLEHHTVFLPGDLRGAYEDLFESHAMPRGLPFYTSVPSVTDSALAPPGDTTLFVLVPVPLPGRTPGRDWASEGERIKERVLERLNGDGIPVSPDRIVFERRYTPEDWRGLFGLYGGSAFGAAHNLLQVGPFRAPNRSPEIRGLYYVGAGTTPGTGVPMVVLGGGMTARQVRDDARRALR
jgi:phytoene desaturase